MASLEFLSDGLIFFNKNFLYLDILRMTISAFLATIFLQSGIDKILNWNSELDWMSKQFENTPLASSLHVGLFVVTILEILGGGLSALGILWILFRDGHSVGLLGTMFCSFSLCILMMFSVGVRNRLFLKSYLFARIPGRWRKLSSTAGRL